MLLDPLRFKQVLSNLVSNAIKFTDRGQVTLRLSMMPGDAPATRRLRVSVSDTGIGISASDRQRLFQPFVQVDPDSRRARSGTGLGLMISKSLCELMGARLDLRSEPGRGTEVRVELVAEQLPPLLHAVDDTPPPPVDLCGISVLVVDDHPANRLLMTQQLSFLGLDAATADTGDSGLRACLERYFDVLFVDCNMPGMDGYDLARHVREQERQSGRTPSVIFGYTASAQHQERERCLAAGMDDCLFKPISLGDLGRVLENVARDRPEDVIDLAQLTPLTGGDPVMQRRLLQQVLDSCILDREALLAATSVATLSDLAHRIKGAARIVAAHGLIQACERLEQACEAGDTPVSPTSVAAAMQALEQTLLKHLAGPADNG